MITNKLTTVDLRKIRQRICPHDSIQKMSKLSFFDWKCSDCDKIFFITEVITIANNRLKEIERVKK